MTTAETIINGCVNPLTEQQRQTLKDLSMVEGNTFAKENKALEEYIEVLKDMYPEKFHRTRRDLVSRVFFDEPASLATPHARFVRARAQSPYLKGLK